MIGGGRRIVPLVAALLLVLAGAGSATAQLATGTQPAPSATDTGTGAAAPESEVRVAPVAGDAAIAARLQRILKASGWFRNPSVRVSEGIVFLDGVTDSEEHRNWAAQVARTTQDVVAVVDRIGVEPQVDWSFAPAWSEIRTLALEAQRVLPLLILAGLVLVVTWVLARLVAWLARLAFRRRIPSPLLLDVLGRAFAIPVVVVGIYLILQVAGLTRLALTVLGGTGLVGLVIGFAFRDIAENFLASLLLSMRNPFRMDDLVRIGEHEGVVQNLNTRSTLLFTLDGNHIQIPNATVYKSVIVNYSSSDSRRTDFVVGIGYDNSTSEAQAVISRLLREHPAVKQDPLPLVLVDELGASTVNLRVYFWFDGKTYSPIKLRSALMRQTKQALIENGISMPDEAREVIFPNGVPIHRLGSVAVATEPKERPEEAPPRQNLAGAEADDTAAEGGLANEDILGEAAGAKVPEAQENLLEVRPRPGEAGTPAAPKT